LRPGAAGCFTSENPVPLSERRAHCLPSLHVSAALTAENVSLPGLRFESADLLSYEGAPLGENTYVDAHGSPVFCVIANRTADAPVRSEPSQFVARLVVPGRARLPGDWPNAGGAGRRTGAHAGKPSLNSANSNVRRLGDPKTRDRVNLSLPTLCPDRCRFARELRGQMRASTCTRLLQLQLSSVLASLEPTALSGGAQGHKEMSPDLGTRRDPPAQWVTGDRCEIAWRGCRTKAAMPQ
jgi:hypothetical protein